MNFLLIFLIILFLLIIKSSVSPFSNSEKNNIDSLTDFSAGSANDSENKDLWVRGASEFIPQLNQILDFVKYDFKIVDIHTFNGSPNVENLSYLFKKYGSDKSDKHNYHILYSYIFKILGEKSKLNVLEIGLGTNNTSVISNMGSEGKPGASLYAFKDYLVNSNIYGADIDKNILFKSERINTTFVDQLNPQTFQDLIENFKVKSFDVIIDDGLHSINANINTLLFALNNINKGGWIIIEDIHIVNNWKIINFILNKDPTYKTYVIKCNSSYLYVINKIK